VRSAAPAHRRSLVVGASVFFALVIGCWTATTPPGSSPDEDVHHIKAVAAAGGDIVGRPDPQRFSPAQRRHLVVRSTRFFEVPGRLVDANYGCNRFRPDAPADCLRDGGQDGQVQRSSYVGTYPPFLYIPAGLLARLGSGPFSAVYFARLVFAALAATLLARAVFVLAGRTSSHVLALVGLFAAATPMALFLAASLNVSGLHMVATLSFGAALIAASRTPGGLRAGWRWTAFSAAITILSRPEGIVWVLLCVALFLLLRREPDPGWYRRSHVLAIGTVVALCTFAVGVWQVLYGSSAGFGLGEVSAGAADVFGHTRSLVDQTVGVFGWVDTRLREGVYLGWAGLIGMLALVAFAVGTARERLAILALPIAAVAAAVGIQVVVLGPEHLTGQLVQARYVMPCALLLPLVAGEVIARWYRAGPRYLVGIILTALGATHLYALYAHSRRSAVGAGGSRLFADAAWSPPGGWPLWALVAAFAFAGLCVAVLTDRPEADPLRS